MQTRRDFIQQKSKQRAGEHSGCAGYTVHQWQQCLGERELLIDDMNEALDLWEARFQRGRYAPGNQRGSFPIVGKEHEGK